MAAALYRPPITPFPAPTVTAFRPPLRAVARQYSNFTTATTANLSPGCDKFNAFQTCRLEGQFGSCVASTSTSYCSCNNGLQYLDCVSAAIATSSCLGIVGDWDDYKRFWILSACPTPPSTVMEAIPQPTTVQLDYESVSTTTLDGPITPAPIPVPTVTYSQGASLLSGDCASTSFSMIRGASMVYYVPFVGCNNERLECCPFNVSTVSPSANAGQFARDYAAVVPGQFPMSKEGGFVTLSRCPQDFYSVSGMCCPNGYFQFTAEVASQTPCFSPLPVKANPPAITAEDPSNPSESNLPTSAIVNVVWALGYSVSASLSSSSSGLSTGAKVGIGIGAALGATALATLGALVLFRRRKRRKSRRQPVPQIDSAIGMTAYKAGYHAPPPGSPPPVSSTTSPSMGQGYGSAWQQQKYSDYPHQGGWQQQQLGQQEQQWASQGPSQGGYQRG